MAARPPAPDGKAWALSRESFGRLLAALHPHPEQAALRYETLRRKLTKLFQWRGCARPEELADVTFDRVARRLDEGAGIQPAEIAAYFHGVAVHVVQEHWRTAAREQPVPEHVLAVTAAPPAVPEDPARERSLDCLDECLAALPAGNRDLLQRYHVPGEGRQIAARKALALERGLTPLALRLRAFRIRSLLAECVTACEGRAGETEPASRA